jgi:radical SAM superfamily enzyme YgiQ (UPF0313 family)/AcrR family transcriptional regulator
MPVAQETAPRRSVLTRARIVELALEIIDEDGLDALNMRRLAAEAGVRPMSLYHHFANKGAILDAVSEKIAAAALGASPPHPRWQGRVRQLFMGLHALTEAHPRALPLISTAVVRTASGRRWMEELMSTLLGAGFSEDRAATVYHVLGAYTLGLGFARMLGDEVQTGDIGRLSEHDAGRHAARRLGPARRVRDRAGRAARPLRRPAGRARVSGTDVGAMQARRAPLRRPLRIKMISPAKTAPDGRFWRSIKYSLFPPLGLATLAGYVGPDDAVDLQDEHVETLDLDDEPDLVVIEAYITSARRAYRYADHYRARGAYVCLGGLHPTSLPEEAARHADSVFCGPGEDTWPAFLRAFRAGEPKQLYRSTERTLAGLPPARRDLIKRERYLVPNSLVVSRGCPHVCDFCYKEAFFRGGRSFYVQAVEDALAEIDRLPGRHLYFLDDNLFGSPPFAEALFDGLRGMGRVWQAAGTVGAVLRPDLLEKAVESGLRSLLVGFETLSEANLLGAGKTQNLAGASRCGATPRAASPSVSPAAPGLPQYDVVVRRLHDLGVMVNGAFVFGMDQDDPSVFARTVEWAVSLGIETATYHILTPYPGTRLERRLRAEDRITSRDWDRYDTRHAVFTPLRMTAAELEAGYRGAYRDFYSWRNIARASLPTATRASTPVTWPTRRAGRSSSRCGTA